MADTPEFDIVIVGAGIAGTAAAGMLARAGRSVALVEARLFERAGPQWVNGVSPWMMERAGVPMVEDEIWGARLPYWLCSPDGTPRVRSSAGPLVEFDMRRLGARLRREAREAGVSMLENARVEDVHLDAGRPRAVAIASEHGRFVLKARSFVDAAGRTGVLRRRVPALRDDCPIVESCDLCTAAQGVFTVDDAKAARAWLHGIGAEPGTMLSFTGAEGGYSIEVVGVEADVERVAILAGTIVDEAHRSGPEMLEDRRRALPWIGAREFGGAGVIPLRQPYHRLVASGIALLGDAACQVFPGHGSGIGPGLVAARMLTDAVAEADDPGAETALWRYAAAFQREQGGVMAAFDRFRRMTQTLERSDLETLLALGLIDEAGSMASIDQRLPPLSGALAGAVAKGLVRAPRLLFRLMPAVLSMRRIVRHWSRYPDRPDRDALVAWSRRAATFFDMEPDVR